MQRVHLRQNYCHSVVFYSKQHSGSHATLGNGSSVYGSSVPCGVYVCHCTSHAPLSSPRLLLLLLPHVGLALLCVACILLRLPQMLEGFGSAALLCFHDFLDVCFRKLSRQCSFTSLIEVRRELQSTSYPLHPVLLSILKFCRQQTLLLTTNGIVNNKRYCRQLKLLSTSNIIVYNKRQQQPFYLGRSWRFADVRSQYCSCHSH